MKLQSLMALQEETAFSPYYHRHAAKPYVRQEATANLYVIGY